MSQIEDLDILFPESDSIKFKSRDDGKEYILRLFVPAGVGFLIIDNIDTIAKIFPNGSNGKPKINKDAINLLIKIMTVILKESYPEISENWVKQNISLPRMAYIVYKLSIPIYEFLIGSGFVGMVMPEKKPTEAMA